MMKILSKVNQCGRTMLEVMGYMSVVMMVSTSIVGVVNNGYYKYRLSRVSQEVVDLKKVVSQRYVAAEGYKDVKMDTLREEKILPYDLADGYHSLGGKITIGGDDSGEMFYIQFAGLPREACVELGVKLWVFNDGSDLDAMQINNGKVWAWPSSYTKNPDYELPAKPTEVAKECDDDWKNVIKWKFN